MDAADVIATTITDEAVPVVPERTFADYAVRPEMVEALARVGILHPFPIQAMTLPVALDGHDIIGQAKTGTGKTLGFGLPLLQRTTGPGEPGFDEPGLPGKPQALVVVPTRELAVQVAGDLTTASTLRSTRVLTVYGGRAYEPQVEALQRGVEVVVGTPGRLLDLAQQGHLDLGHVRCLVLDEADEMLDLGFLPDVERLLALTPSGRQMMLFSATMPGAVVSLARRFMAQPTHIRAIDPTDDGATLKAITQVVYRAHALDKVEMLARMLQAEGRGLVMIFARTKRTVAKVAESLTERGFAAAAIHGDLGQGAREQALRAFRGGKVDVLVATDVAARGIDVEGITHVVNYQCPEDEKTYLHRIGRTGRAGRTGVAVTFVDWDDMPKWGMIDRTLDLGIPEPVETYSRLAALPRGACASRPARRARSPAPTAPAPASTPSRSRTSARPASSTGGTAATAATAVPRAAVAVAATARASTVRPTARARVSVVPRATARRAAVGAPGAARASPAPAPTRSRRPRRPTARPTSRARASTGRARRAAAAVVAAAVAVRVRRRPWSRPQPSDPPRGRTNRAISPRLARPLGPAQGHTGPVHLIQTVGSQPREVSRVRHLVADALHVWGVTSDDTDVVVLLTSEPRDERDPVRQPARRRPRRPRRPGAGRRGRRRRRRPRGRRPGAARGRRPMGRRRRSRAAAWWSRCRTAGVCSPGARASGCGSSLHLA
nr:DEAD/DEAH box helicase [Angustibacter aerolatus]